MHSVLVKLFDLYFSKHALPSWGLICMDSVIICMAGYVSYFLVYPPSEVIANIVPVSLGLAIIVGISALSFFVFRTYRSVVRFSSFVDLRRIGYALFCSAVAAMSLSLMVHHSGCLRGVVYLPGIQVFLTMYFFSLSFMWLERLLIRAMYDYTKNKAQQCIFILGVGDGGVSLAHGIQGDSNLATKLVGFVDNYDKLTGHQLMGVPVYKCDITLPQIMQRKHAKTLLISPLQSSHFREQTDVIDALIDAGIRIKMLPPLEHWDGHSPLRQEQLHEIEIEDLLPRSAISVDMDTIGQRLKGRCVLITGAAGSIGSEIARQVASCGPSSLILIDQAETPMHDMRREMARDYSQLPHVSTIVCSICQEERIEQIFAQYRPEYVFHAAAYKHVPMMEDNPHMAIINNVWGTRIVADLAVKYGVRKFVMVSTDKAVNPTNVMGCSKRICEIYCQSLGRKIAEEQPGKEHTQFITTRFGNVLGSNGSFVPIFKEQIKAGGPVTVTHPDIVRYFMLIPEACQLVLTAGMLGHGGEIYVFDMGQPVRIADVARRMIRLSGARDVQIEYTGLRDGEKLYEEVLAQAEVTKPTEHPKILVAAVREYPYEQALHEVERLRQAALQPDDMAIVRLMKDLVPEFRSQHSKYQALDA
ncbi:MAG: polysaccharide biosynthesis protein [Bacteroidaceae bacterium]|nr:polysaccharide biosynthesis protein [Bacteroidaceae bacterium]